MFFSHCQQNRAIFVDVELGVLREAAGKSFQLPFSVASLVLGIFMMCYRWRKRPGDAEGEQSLPGEAEDEKFESFLASKHYTPQNERPRPRKRDYFNRKYIWTNHWSSGEYWRCLKIVQKVFDYSDDKLVEIQNIGKVTLWNFVEI